MSNRLKYSPINNALWELIEIDPKAGLKQLINTKSGCANKKVNEEEIPAFLCVAFKKADLIAIYQQKLQSRPGNTCEYLVFTHFLSKFDQPNAASTLFAFGEDFGGQGFVNPVESVFFIGTPNNFDLSKINQTTLIPGTVHSHIPFKWAIPQSPPSQLSEWLTKSLYPLFKQHTYCEPKEPKDCKYVKSRIKKQDFVNLFGFSNPKNLIVLFPAVFPCEAPNDKGVSTTQDYCTLLAAELSSTGAPLSTTDFKMLVLTDTWRPNWPRTTGFKGLFNYLSEKTNELFSGLSKLFK